MKVEFAQLGSAEIIVFFPEGGGVRHRSVKPESVERIADIVVPTNVGSGCPLIFIGRIRWSVHSG